MKKILSILLLTFIFISPLWGYEKLTEDEAEQWLQSIEYSTLLDFIIDYDYVEHSKPEIDFPNKNYMLIDSDLVITPTEDMNISIGHLQYSVEQKQEIIYDFYEVGDKTLGKTILVSAGFVLGAFTGIGIYILFF